MKNIFNRNEYVLLDGAMGTMLQSGGLELGERPELLSITHPDRITAVHRMYVESGADIVYANTFGANAHKLEGAGYTVEEVITAAVQAAKAACVGSDALVGLDVGPLGELLEPAGTLSFEGAYELFQEMVVAGEKAGADVIVFETMTDLYEVKAGVLAAKENTKLPIMVSMTFESNHRTFAGCTVEAMAMTLEGLGVDAVGINCSLGPVEIFPMAKELCSCTTLPVFVKPNAGLPNLNTDAYDIGPVQFTEELLPYKEIGISMLGGCCGTSPDYIKALGAAFKGQETTAAKRKEAYKPILRACSPTAVVHVDHVAMVGESINPMGRKFIKQAYLNDDMDTILACGVEQVEHGAEILDVNAALPGVDETIMLSKVVKLLQSVVDAPLLLDSQNPEALEAALRVYNGKPMINSTNGEQELMDKLFPLAKKYGAAIVGLTLDEEGIPATAEKRLEVARRIVNTGLAYGIPREDLMIDCLTLAASVQQKEALETPKAIRMIKEELGVKVLLGVSNISFGLPQREIINRHFLTTAMDAGLDLPIMNPKDQGMKEAIYAYNVLSGQDEGSKAYIDRFGGQDNSGSPGGKSPQKDGDQKSSADIFYAVRKGLKNEAKLATEQLLETMEEMAIINEKLIPALDELGAIFEKGEIFLPQLVQGAQAAQMGFEVVNRRLALKDAETVNRGKIVLATVKGDVHDIGKNIVKIILQNYGYQIIDLGRDVAIEAVVEAVQKHGAGLVGLSALMTTTLKSMEETIAAIHQAKLDCKVLVGGAVLTADYAKAIQADYYAKDAKQSADIAKKVFGN
ncbi:dihydropteroate synthase [Aminipila butyrica]|uniref:Methionine synthase n=1 Tax=Aminipila butyrica TaxID=433296 RepID=A0A858BUT9_9FIRM|nr:homocysteine S-methyltransferase family protein [Aminipila butyrica]QIB68544.1 dihydropteroate synthase [Aminipila butyrica]